jgi:tetratricopeptide (TPR) repeat protein
VKRVLLATVLVLACLALVYGYGVTRRERLYRQSVVQGDQALARSDGFAAVHAFTEAIARKPDSMLGYLKRGEAHRRRGDLEAAAADLRQAAILDPTEPRVLELLGDVESARQLYERASGNYAAALALDDRAPRVLYKLGLSEYLDARLNPAADALRKAVDVDPRFAEAHYLLGVVLRESNKSREAERALKRALSLAPTLTVARELLGELYRIQHRRTEYLGELERLLNEDPSAARHVALARACVEAGDMPRALRLLRSAAELYPDHAATHVALGRLWLTLAEGPGGRASVRNAISALEHAVALDRSGVALMELGRARLLLEPAAAEQAFAQAARRLPVDPLVFLHLADAAERAGHTDVARRALIDYLSLLPPADPRHASLTARVATLSSAR